MQVFPLARFLPLSGLILLALALPAFPAADAEKPAGKAPKDKPPTNRLARESSPYLLQHAHNPVDWYPWGPEAFARAKKENKLVFLSIGYSSCHWCHVMEKESFSHPEVAKILNKHFICIKVDREERPEIDHVYLTALNVMGNRGGWPLSMWLLPDGRPIVGGTYWPREDKEIDGEKVRGFQSLLLVIQNFWEKKPEDIREQAQKLAQATTEALTGNLIGTALVELDRKLVAAGVEEVREGFDKVHGGFGNPARNFRGTKFPMPPYLLFLQAESARRKAPDLEEIVRVTLDHMAQGGIYDHLGGGFHRYSTERTWTVPHFEKMLYDNAQLLEVYAHACQRDKQSRDAQVLRQTLDFVQRELTAPEGGFYSALDADSEGEEGRFYVWTKRELDAVLTNKADKALLEKVYGVEEGTNFEGQYHILRLPKSLRERAAEMKLSEEQLEARLGPLRRKLFAVREPRARPFLDTKVVTGWNGQMIAGMARAGQALGDKKAIAQARRTADFLWDHLRTPDGRLLRTWAAVPGQKPRGRGNGYLDDYAYFVHGLLALHDVTGEARWLARARQLTDTQALFHADPEHGAFFYTSSDHEKLFARAKDQFDGAQPSANSVTAGNLVRLWQKTGEKRYGDLAGRSFRAFAGSLKTGPGNLTGLLEALALYLDVQEKKP
jgi:uncharacterized protein YyaL (SSP411 family)